MGLGAMILLAACGSTSNATGPAVAKTTATGAEGTRSRTEYYIFPLGVAGYFTVADLSQFQYLLYRPLYWFGNNGQVNSTGA